ncbi:MAG: M48 family metalloprotease [Acidobacteriota bacterium]|nr:M48 family metalloprotease [Acidobacteriota bacterium]
MKPEVSEPCLPGVPPWMWYWIVTAPLSLSRPLREWSVIVADTFTSPELVVDQSTLEQAFVLWFEGQKLAVIFSGLPALFLILGLFTVLLPQLRSFYIERRNKLLSLPPPSKSLTEIEGFIKLHAPGLQLKFNLKRPGRLWVYPNGYRKATLAIFSGFVMLWKTDREAAEAVLLHEIAHYRRGDALFLGPGGFFEIAVKLTLLSTGVQVLIWFAFPIIVLHSFIGSDNRLEIFFLSLRTSLIFIVQLPFTLALLITGVFIVPIFCVWSAELNADYFVANYPKHKTGLLRALSKKTGKLVWWRWILFRLSHPPESMRQFFLRRSNSYAFSLLLLIYPLSFFVRFALLCAFDIVKAVKDFAYSSVIKTIGSSPTENANYISNIFLQWPFAFRDMIVSQSHNFLMATVILLAWSFVARPWERFFTSGQDLLTFNAMNEAYSTQMALSSITPQKSSRFSYYAVAAAFTSVVFLVALIWRD